MHFYQTFSVFYSKLFSSKNLRTLQLLQFKKEEKLIMRYMMPNQTKINIFSNLIFKKYQKNILNTLVIVLHKNQHGG